MIRIDGLIKRLEWAQSKGITHVDVFNSPSGTHQIITGQTEDGQIKQIYPMSDEEKEYLKSLKPKSDKPKKEPTVNNDDWRYSDRDDEFDDLDDDYFGSENSWNESVKDKKVIKLTEKDLANLVKRVIKEQRK